MPGAYHLYCEGDVQLLFTENETNYERIFGTPNQTPFVKDGINDYIVNGRQNAVNPDKTGTKVAAHYRLEVGPGQSAIVRLRLTKAIAAQNAKIMGASLSGRILRKLSLRESRMRMSSTAR